MQFHSRQLGQLGGNIWPTRLQNHGHQTGPNTCARDASLAPYTLLRDIQKAAEINKI